MWIRQLFFSNVAFLPSGEISVVFNISSLHSNTNLPIRRYSHENIFISKNSSIYMLPYTYNHIYEDSTYNTFYKNPHSSNFYRHFSFEVQTLLCKPYLHSYNLCWTKSLFSPEIKLNIFKFMFFKFIWNTKWSIWIINMVTTPFTLINTYSKRIKKEFY